MKIWTFLANAGIRIIFLGKVAISALIIVATAFFIPVLPQISHLIVSVDKQVNALGDFLNKDPRGIQGTFSNLNAILVQTGLAADELRVAAQTQEKYWNKTSKDLNDTIAKVDLLLESGDQTTKTLNLTLTTLNSAVSQLNDKTIPASTDTIISLKSAVDTISSNSQLLLVQTTGTMTSAKMVLDTANDILVKSKLDETFGNLELTTKYLSGTSHNVEETTGYIKDMFTPTKKSFWRSVVETYLPIGIRSVIPQRTIIQNTPTVKTEQK